MTKRIACLAILAMCAVPASAQLAFYTDEALFLADATTLGYCIDSESFEDDAVWGHVRSTVSGGFHTAPSVTSLGITWLPNTVNSGVTTGEGPARTGQWGFYEYPHGDFDVGINDGFVVEAVDFLYAAGLWLVTNTPGAKIVFVIDDTTVVDFAGANQLGVTHTFFGVIDPAGFTVLEVRETEGSAGQQLFVFADDAAVGRTECFGAIFADGFESGDTSAWSAVVP